MGIVVRFQCGPHCRAGTQLGSQAPSMAWRAIEQTISLRSVFMSWQLVVTVTSPALFKERVSTETLGRLPLGPVVLLGLLSGRLTVYVLPCLCIMPVCAHVCLCAHPFKAKVCQTTPNNILLYAIELN